MAERRRSAGPPGADRRRRRSNEDVLARLNNRVEAARKLRRDWKQKYKVDELWNAFHGTDAADIFGQEATTNRFWPTIKTIVPALFFENPKFDVRPIVKNPIQTASDHAAQAEGLLEALANQEFMLKRAVKLALLQSFFMIGVLKVSYDPKEVPNPQAGETVMQTDLVGNPVVDPFTGEPQPVTMSDGRILTEPNRIMDDEAYEWVWVNANNMLLPDHGPDMRTWPWLGEEVTVALEDAKEDERFPRALRRQLVPNSRDEDERQFRLFPESDTMNPDVSDREVTYIEHWDMRERRHYITIDGQPFSDSDFLLNEPTPKGVEDHPYSILPGFTPIIAPKPSPWPLPHVYNWLHIQNEYNMRRLQMTNGANRTARKVFYDQSTFADEDSAINALESPNDMQAVELTSIERPPVTLQDPPLPPNIVQDVGFIIRDWLMVTGQPGSRFADSRAATATEATFEVQSAEVRDVDMRAEVADWLSEAGQKMLQLLKATLTLGRYVEMRGFNDEEFRGYVETVYGPEILQQIGQFPGIKEAFRERFGQRRWQMVTRESLDFESTVRVVPGSFRPRTLEAERAQIIEFLTLFAQAPQLGMSRELLRIVGNVFEFIDSRMLDELHALSRQQVEINARQAGRHQGGGDNGQVSSSAGLSALFGGI